jgi:hypothetical protein
MKKTITLCIAVFITVMSFGQSKKDSIQVVQITIDTTSFFHVTKLIQESIPSNTETGKLLLQSILAPLYQSAKLIWIDKPIADKPK